MGLHIIPYKFKGRDSEGYLITESVNIPGFDTARHSGDRDFAGTIHSTQCWTHVNDLDAVSRSADAEFLYRPTPNGYTELTFWIEDNVAESNKPRLYRLLNFLIENPDIYLYFSY